MPNNITDTAAWTATIQYPADGEPVNGASEALAPQGLANRTAYLKDRTKYNTRAIALAAGVNARLDDGSTHEGIFQLRTSSTVGWYQTSILGGGAVEFALDLPDSGVLDGATCKVSPAGGHGALPTTKPTLALIKTAADGTRTTLATVTDSSANPTAYEVPHVLTLSGVAHTIDPTCAYSLRATGEGSDGVAFLVLNTFTQTTVAP